MKIRKIAPLDLASFQKPMVAGNPSRVILALWYLINALVFRGSIFGLVPSWIKTLLLRMFGAKVESGVVIKPRVGVKSPWFLYVGDHVWIGEGVWIDNHTTVEIGSNSCISQGAYIFTGNHDWNDPSFAFFCKPVLIGSGVWVTAFCRVTPGSTIPDAVAVLPD